MKRKTKILAIITAVFMLFQVNLFSAFAEETTDGNELDIPEKVAADEVNTPDEENGMQVTAPKPTRDAEKVTRDIDGNIPMASFIKNASIKVNIGGKWYDSAEIPPGTAIEKDSPVEVRIEYDPEGQYFTAGDSLIYQIPNGITIEKDQHGDVTSGPEVAGTYHVDKTGRITISFNEAYLKKHEGYVQNGTIGFDGRFDKTKWDTGGDKEIVFGDIIITIPFKPDPVVEKGNLNVKKEINKDNNGKDIQEDSQGKYIEYRVTVSTPGDNTMDIEDVNVEDMFSAGGNYVAMIDGHPDIFGINTNNCGNFEYDSVSQHWKWTGIGDMAKGESHVLTFKVRLNVNIYQPGTDTGDRVITNKVEAKSGNDTKNQATVSAKSNSGLNIKKTTGGYNAENKSITYKVVVTAPQNNSWTINNVTVDDIFGENSRFIDEYRTITITPGKGSITNQNKDTAKKLVWNIGNMAPGETAELNYTVKVNDSIFLEGTGAGIDRTIINTAYLKVGGNDKSNSSASVKFTKEWIKKNGTFQTSGVNAGKVKFVIQANKTGTAISSENSGNSSLPPFFADNTVTFEDELTGDWVYDGDIVIKKYNRGSADKETPVKTFELSDFDGKSAWTWTDPNPGAYYYEIEYYARAASANAGSGIPGLNNSAGVVIGIGNNNYDHGTTWNGTGANYDALSKNFVSIEKAKDPDTGDVTEAIAKWQSKITYTVPEGAVYEDYRDSDHAWSFTEDQLKNIKVSQGGKNFVKDTDYKLEKTSNGYKITFNKKIEASESNPILIDYSCTLKTDNLKELESAKYVNKASLTINGHKDTTQADCSYTKEQLIKKTAGDYDRKTGELSWNIKVNTTGDLKGSAKVTDLLPEELEYVSAEITNHGSKAGATTMSVEAGSKDPENGTQLVTMNLENLVDSGDRNAYVDITLKTRIADEKFFISNTTQTFSNTATLEYDSIDKTSTAETKIKNTTMTKSGSYDKNTAPYFDYTIEVNPDGIDMLKNPEVKTVKITDEMGEGMMLKSDSLVVKDKKTGAQIDIADSMNIDTANNTFSFDVPDDKPLTITYKVYIMGEVGDKVDISNKVSYYGEAESETSHNKNNMVILKGNATIEGVPAFYILKKDGTDKKTVLEGAEYTLYEFDSKSKTFKTKGTYTSEDDGIVCFSDLDDDGVYAFCETKAPAGYYIDAENAQKTYVAFKHASVTDDVKAAIKQHSGIENAQVDIIQGGITYDRFNYKGEIKLDKVFHTNGGMPIPDGDYYFGLYQEDDSLLYIGENPAVEKITVKDGKPVAVDGQAEGSLMFKSVPVGENGAEKTYYVYETDSDGKKLEKDSTGAVLINGAKFKVSGEGVAVRVSGEDPMGEISLTNDEQKLEITLLARKQLDNVAETTKMKFNFGLYDKNGELIAETESTENGKIAFNKKLSYTRADVGIHRYTVKEIVPDGVTADNPVKDGIRYDFTAHKITVDVKHSVETGLTAEVKVNGNEVYEVQGKPGVYKLPHQDGKEAAFVNTFTGSVELIKTNGMKGSEKSLLQGAEFEIYRVFDNEEDTETSLIGKFTTDKNGRIYEDNLAEGSYYLVETKAPKGYKPNLDADGNAVKYAFEIGPNGGKQVIDYALEIANTEIKDAGGKIESDETKTGDASNMGIFALLTIISAVAAGIVLVRRRPD